MVIATHRLRLVFVGRAMNAKGSGLSVKSPLMFIYKGIGAGDCLTLWYGMHSFRPFYYQCYLLRLIYRVCLTRTMSS